MAPLAFTGHGPDTPHRPAHRRRQRVRRQDRADPRGARSVGETSIRRAYGNWTKPGLKSWAAVLHENAIRPMQQYDYSSGKNASDMAMVVDAMALLYTDRPDAFGIVSSDADFTPLVMHLREQGRPGLRVRGGEDARAVPDGLHRFLRLDQLSEPEEEVAEPLAEAAASEAASTAAPTTTTTKRTTRGRRLRQQQQRPKRRGLRRSPLSHEGRCGHQVCGLPCSGPAQPERPQGRRAARADAAQRGRGCGRRGGLGQGQHRRPRHLQQVVVRLTQLRVRLAEQAAQGHEAVRDPRRGQRRRPRCGTSGWAKNGIG